MKLLTILEFLFLVAVFGIANGFLEDTEFQVLIKERCYNRTNSHKRLVNGQFVPLSNSMETFIDMLEEFERNHTAMPAMNIIEIFLKRFRIDGMRETQEDRFSQRLKDKERLHLIQELLRPTAKLSDFPEDAFDEQKKCALYYMLSHAVTIVNEEHLFPTKSPDDRDSKTVVEQGVVTLNNNPIHSIALGKVLLGILAGFKNYKDRSVKEILEAVKTGNRPVTFMKEPEQLKGFINPLYGVTIGDTIAAEVLRSVNETLGRVRKFGPNGKWNSTICPTKYVLNGPATDATYAEIRGAGDGFILGLQVAKLKEKNVQIPISTLLRMYYSPRGIPSTSTYSYCRRWDNWGEFNDKGLEQIHHYSRLMNIHISSGVYYDRELQESAKAAISEFENSKDDIVGSIIQKPESCFDVDSDREPSCETPSDVFVVIDNRGIDPILWKRQKESISLLSTNLDLRYYGGRINIFSNSRGDVDRSLEPLIVNGTSLSCVGCKLDWYLSSMTNVDETYVLESLYKTLTQYELDRSASHGVPGKSIVYFNFGDFVKDDRNFKNAHWELTNKHRDAQIFVVGSNKRVLEHLATDQEKIISDDNVNEIAATLKQEICESPGIIQYPNCRLRRSTMDKYDSAFSGYVTPKRIQYWSMFPEFFLKSFEIKFQFTATGGNIKVCYSRNKHHLLKGENCKETSPTEPTIIFSMSNPCKGKNVYNCDPFHFAIEGKDTASHDPKCIDKECKTFDQIKFLIQHEGVSCNRSTQLFSSFVLLVLSLFYLMKMNQ